MISKTLFVFACIAFVCTSSPIVEKDETSNLQATAETDSSSQKQYETILDSMVSMGETMKIIGNINPVEMAVNIVGRPQMLALIADMTQIMTTVQSPTPTQLEAAERILLSIGSEHQTEAIQQFIQTLTPEQVNSINDIQEKMASFFPGSVVPPTETNKMTQEQLEEKAKTQALLVIEPITEKKSTFKNLIPMLNQVTLYAGVVLPTLKASKAHQRNKELSEGMLLQTISDASRKLTPQQQQQQATSDLEKYLPTADDLLDAMIKIGRVVSGNEGFNSVEMMTHIVGESEMKTIINDIMHFPLRFPDLTEPQIMAAEQAALKVGLGFGTQEEALNGFLATLDDEQKNMIATIEKDVVEKLIGSMILPNGDPSPKLVEEIKNQIRELKTKTGSTEGVPEEFKPFIADVEHDAKLHAQTLIAIATSDSPQEFKNLLPLVRQASVFTGIILPSIKAKKSNVHNKDLTNTMLLQTVATAGKLDATPQSDLEKALPSAEDMLGAMVAIGNVIGGSSGFNPIQMMSNLVGKDNMTEVIQEVMFFPFRFPDITDNQLAVAEEAALSLGLGFMTQEQAVNKFVDSLDAEQKRMLDSMEKNVIERLMNALVTPDGQPTTQLIQEIQSEMREMERRKGSTDMMPQELKDLVAEATKSSIKQ